ANAGNSTTARVTGSLLAFIKTNNNMGASGAVPVYTNIPTGTRTDGTTRAFSETILKDVLQQCFTSGAKPDSIMTGAVVKQETSTFSGVATKTFYQSGTGPSKIIGAADIYVSDFGTLTIIPNRFQRSRDVFFLDWDMVSVNYLRPFDAI